MREVADDVWLLTGLRGPVNAYLVGTVLIDAGGPWDAGYLLSTLEDLDVLVEVLADQPRKILDRPLLPARMAIAVVQQEDHGLQG